MHTPARVALGLLVSVLSLPALADANVTATKSVSGSFVQGTNVTYTIVITNEMAVTQPNNPGNEFRDPMPSGLLFVSAEASSGTASYLTTIDTVAWDGAIPSGESVTLTITATINPTASGTISNQGRTFFDADSDGSNESNQFTDDPSTGTAGDATSFNVIQSGTVSATKSASGSFAQGTDVTYTIIMTNDMTAAQGDNDGHEFSDVMPDNITVSSVSATSGTIVSSDNVVFWDGALAAGESVTLTIVAAISPVVLGTIDNQGSTSFDRDGDNQNESTQVTDDPSTEAVDDPTGIDVVSAGSLFTATKTLTNGSFVPGSQVTYQVVLTNHTGVAQADNPGHEFTDAFLPGLTLDFASSDVGSLGSEPDSNVLTWDGALADGQSANITIKATIDPSANIGDTLSNQATITFDANGDGTNEQATVTDDPTTEDSNDPTRFTVVSADGLFTATKTVSGTFVTGTDVTYTVTLTNDTGYTQTNNLGNEFTDVLPSSLILVSASASSGTAAANTGTNTVTWNGSIADGASVTLTITATIDPSAFGTISNQGTVSYDSEGNNRNDQTLLTDNPSSAAANDATTFNVIQSGIVEVTKSVSGTFVQGTDVTYTIVLTNHMNVTQPDNFGHEFADILPTGLTFVSVNATSGDAQFVAGIAVVWNGSIPAGGTVTITIVCTINPTANGTISNQGNSIFDRDGDNQNESEEFTDDPSTAADDDPTSFNVIQSGIVSSTMSVSGTFVQGTNVTYTVVMTNNMTVTQPDNFGHEWTNGLPSGLTFVSATATSGTIVGCCGNSVVFWDGSIPSGASVTLTFVATISPTATGTISNRGQTIFDRDGDGQNESSQTNDVTSFNVIQSGIVSSTMSVSGTFVQGTNVTYTVVMTNNMTVTQPDNFGHEWTNGLPSGLTFVSATATSGTIVGCCGNSVVFWDGSIPSGASVTLTFVVMISPTATGTISNQGQTIFDRDGDGQNESSQTNDASTFNVIQSGIVSSTMSVSGTFVQGTNVTYTVVMTNNMTVTQPDNFGHEWTNGLPSGLTFVSATATSGTIVGCCGNSVVFWDGSIASGASVTLTIVATISPTATGTISNQGQTIFDRDGDGQNESSQTNDVTSFNVIQSGIVSSTMSVSGTFVQGTNVTYTVVMTNNMTVMQPDNFGHEWTNNLPSTLTPISVSATSGTIAICCANSIVFWDGSIAAGASVTLTIVATISPTATGTISNQGQTIFDRDGDGQNESSQTNDVTSFTVIANQADLSLTMSYLPSTIGQHENVTYTLVVTNGGPLTATNVVVTDDRPDDATFQSVSTTQGSCTTADPVVCSIGSLANGASATITLVLTTPSNYSSMTNTATAASDLPDSTPASASASFSCTKSNGKPCKK